MRTFIQITPQNYYKKMEVPNKLVKKTIYARINEFFVTFIWNWHVSANVFSEGTHPVGEGACRKYNYLPKYFINFVSAFVHARVVIWSLEPFKCSNSL